MTSLDQAKDFYVTKRIFQTKAEEWENCRKDTILKLRNLANQLDTAQRETESEKKGAAKWGMLGGGLAFAGVGLSLVTGGASLGLVGIGASLTGAGCSLYSCGKGAIIGNNETNTNKSSLEQAFKKLSEEFFDLLKKLQDLASDLQVDLKYEVSESEIDDIVGVRGVVFCSGAMVSTLTGLGLLASRLPAIGAASRPLYVVNLTQKILETFKVSITVSLSPVRSSLQGFLSSASGLVGTGAKFAGYLSKAVKVGGGVLAVVGAGLDVKAYNDASRRECAVHPSEIAQQLRRVAKRLEGVETGSKFID